MYLWIVMQVCLAVWSCNAAPGLVHHHPLKHTPNEWASYYDQGVDTYAFGYDVEDPKTGNVQYRQEERFPNGTVIGSYGILEADGNVKIVHYVADERGYRVNIENSLRKLGGYPPLTLLKALNPLHVIYPRVDKNLLPETPSPQLTSALGSLSKFPSNLFEQHTRPSSNQNIPQPLGFSASLLENNSLKSSSDQSQNYPAFLPAPLGFVA